MGFNLHELRKALAEWRMGALRFLPIRQAKKQRGCKATMEARHTAIAPGRRRCIVSKNSETLPHHLPAFEYVNVIGDGWAGHINLFFGGHIIALVRPHIAAQIKTAIPVVKRRSSQHDICSTCSGVGFSGAPSFPCGACGTKATPPIEEQK